MIPVYECRGKKKALTYPCYAQVKLDGEYCVYDKGKFISKYGNERTSKHMSEKMKLNAVLLGEYYWHSGTSGSLYQLLSHKNHDECKFGIFDIIEFNGMDMRNTSMVGRIQLLQHLLPRNNMYVHLVETTLVDDEAMLDDTFATAVASGYEGIVAKNMLSKLNSTTTRWVKMKNKITADLEVVLIDPTRERIEVKVNADITCGVKVIPRYKAQLSVGDIVEVEYQGQINEGSLRHPVFVRIRKDKRVGDIL